MPAKPNRELSHINNLTDLKHEIASVKVRLRTRESDLSQRMSKLPKESFKASLGAVVPIFLNNKIAHGTWDVLKIASGMLLGTPITSKNKIKYLVLRSAQKIGVFALLKGAVNAFKHKNK